ncbi:MAG: hypothetical protein WCW77_04060 [Patescibacteria group bacterium]|jgi:hypothetical protein
MRTHKLVILFAVAIIVTLGLSISFQSLLAVWISPTVGPPGGNIDTPLNISTTFQTKNGGLSLNHLGAPTTNGLLVENGNVGIGTLGPGAKLEVNGNILLSNDYIDLGTVSTDSTAGVYWHTGGSGNDYGIYRSSGAWVAPYAQLTLDWPTGIVMNPGMAYGKSFVDIQGGGLRVTAGNVGIGSTAAPGIASGGDTGAKLELTTTSAAGAAGNGALRWYGNNGGYVGWIAKADAVIDTNGWAGARLSFTTPNSSGNPLQTLTMKNGNVGIGTLAPISALHVYSATSGIITDSAAADQARVGWAKDGTLKWLGYVAGSSNDLNFWDGTDNRVTFKRGGNVGIGTTEPTKRLDVAGAIHASGDICTDQGGGNCLSTIASGVLPVNFVFAHATANRWDHCPAGYVQLFSLNPYFIDDEGDYGYLGFYYKGGTSVGGNYLEVCRKLNPDELYGGIHTEAQCTAAGGTVYWADYCLFTGYCASGWTYVANWSATYPNTCTGATGDGCPGSSCSTGSHGWSNTPAETCTYGNGYYEYDVGCNTSYITCTANFAQTLCY